MPPRDADGRPLIPHHADLHVAGVGAEEHAMAEEESVLHVTGRMILGHVQRSEVVPVVFYLWAFRNIESNGRKNIDNLVFN